jgi:hypothetical protein
VKSVDGLLYAVDNGQRKLLVPQCKLRKSLMHGLHDALVSGHFGFNKAYERIRQGVTWTEMYSELKAYVRSCDFCQRNKTSGEKPVGMLKPLEFPTERFKKLSMDFITTLPETKASHDAVMVIVEKGHQAGDVYTYHNLYGHGDDSEAILQSFVEVVWVAKENNIR